MFCFCKVCLFNFSKVFQVCDIGKIKCEPEKCLYHFVAAARAAAEFVNQNFKGGTKWLMKFVLMDRLQL